MADINITQGEADKLLAMEKKAVDQTQWTFPGPADRIVVPLTSFDKRENFLLDVTRYQIKLTKATFQNRARVVIVLYRLDIDERLTATRTAKKFPVRTCTSIAKASATNGQSQQPSTNSRTH
jgi:hypothetical protein